MRRLGIISAAIATLLGATAYGWNMIRIVWPQTDGLAAPGTGLKSSSAEHIHSWCRAAIPDAFATYRGLLLWAEPLAIVGFAVLIALTTRGRLARLVWVLCVIWVACEAYELALLLDRLWCFVTPNAGWVLYPPPQSEGLTVATGMKWASFLAMGIAWVASRITPVGKPRPPL